MRTRWQANSRAVIGATLLTLGYDVNTTDPAQLEEAKAKLKELVPNVKLFDSDSPKSALIAGDVDLGLTWTGEAFLAQQEVPAIQFVYPTEGAILWQDNYAMPVDAPHPDAAYATDPLDLDAPGARNRLHMLADGWRLERS